MIRLMKADVSRLALLVLMVGGLSGCATIEPPDVTLIALGLTDISVLETTGEVSIRLTNPHPEALKVDGAEFKLYLDGLKVGRVLVDEQTEVPRLGTAVLDGKLFINNLAVVTRLTTILESEKFSYRMTGKVFLLGDFGRQSVRVDRDGTIDMNEAAERLDSL